MLDIWTNFEKHYFNYTRTWEDENLVLKVEVPGVPREDISLDVRRNCLYLKAGNKTKVWENVDDFDIEASLDLGVLRIVLKPKEAELKSIKIR